MRQVILSMKDYIFADAVAKSLQADEQGGFNVVPTTSTEEVLQYGISCEPYAVLMEVNGYPPYVLAERLKLRDAIKEKSPGCKIVLVVDENSEKEVAEEVREAKKAGRIDQFIYGSISANYLVALMDTL